ncbi:hypothetical protein ASG32_27710 [Methylobacterium sp. Leaf361]|nr:hypothetical protein ASG32_27710 [Methylobacterium sp. Leaf361]
MFMRRSDAAFGVEPSEVQVHCDPHRLKRLPMTGMGRGRIVTSPRRSKLFLASPAASYITGALLLAGDGASA